MKNGRFHSNFGALAGIATLLAAPLASQATTVIPKSVQDCVHDADAIFVGHVTKSAARWGTPAHQWIYTDITFHIDEALEGNDKVQADRDITLTYWGGTIGNRSALASDMVYPTVGEKWVLMLRPDLARQTLTPVVGFQQGMLRVDHDATTGQDLVHEAEGGQLFQAPDGAVVRGFERTTGQTFRADVTLNQFETWFRTNLSHIKATPAKRWPAPDRNDPRVLKTFSKTPATAATQSDHAPLTTAPAVPAAPADQTTAPVRPAKPIIREVSPTAATGEGRNELIGAPSEGAIRPDWSSFGSANVPIVVNNFPSWMSPWSPEDQYALSRWNYYANIYEVYANPTGTFAADDGVFDLDGWPDDGTMYNVYGQHWDTAGGILAITIYYLNGSTIEDADIAFNPAWAWTLDDNWVFSGGNAWPFRSTMQHEQGHMFGLKHDFYDLSIMNYSPHDYRALAVPYMEDAEAIRSIYPNQLQDVQDLGVYLWTSTGYQSWSDPSFPSSVVAGDDFFINNYHIENVGTETIGNPTLDWYLTTSLNYTDPYYYLATISYNTTLYRFWQYNDSSVGVYLNVPSGVPGGNYYINAYIPNDGGGLNFPFNNNEGWSHTQITVYPLVTAVAVSPDPIDGGTTTTGTLYLGSTAGPGGLWAYVSSDNASVPDPGWVNVPQGWSYVDFSIPTYASTAPTQANLTASSNGHSTSAVLYLTVPTAVQVGNVSGTIGTTVNLTATLTRTSDNTGVAGETLYFYVDGAYVGYSATDGNGNGILPYTLTDTTGAGQHTVGVYFFGDYYYYDASSNGGTLTINPAKTTLSVANASGTAGQAVTLTSTLKRITDKAGASGATINFSVAGNSVGSATTNASGVATLSYTIPSGTLGGNEAITAQFAGNSNYNASSGKGTLAVKAAKVATAITVTNVSGNRGGKVTLKGVLKTTSGTAVSGASLQFLINGTSVGTGTTSAAGAASFVYSIPKTAKTGAQTITVKYAGNAAYLASSATGTLTIH